MVFRIDVNYFNKGGHFFVRIFCILLFGCLPGIFTCHHILMVPCMMYQGCVLEIGVYSQQGNGTDGAQVLKGYKDIRVHE